ncbi:hypothetical protein BGX31_007200 [Mortierella sp. GBA43]|nr:hypothetical protein BGX31_007200 [Mortierella sp. GBA43]
MDKTKPLSCTYTCKPAPVAPHWIAAYTWPILLLVLAIIIYFARDYPKWKADRQRQKTRPDTQSSSTTPGSVPSSSSSTPEPSPEQQESLLSARWIPYLPLAVVLVTIKAVWESLRHLVLRSILAIEESGPYLKARAKEAAHWIVYQGPGFVRTKIFEPTCTLTTLLWNSLATTVEHTIAPAVVRFYAFSYEHLKGPVANTLAWMLKAVTFILHAVQWVLLELLYRPALAFWNRISVLGRPLALAAKTTLDGLAKDARDLCQFVLKIATLAWERTLLLKIHLRKLGAKLREWKELTATHVTTVVLPWCTLKSLELKDWSLKSLEEFLPWALEQLHKLCTEVLPKVADKAMTKVIRPAGKAIANVVQFIESHPTFVEGVRALSLMAAESLHTTLKKIENVNWLMVLEEALLTLWAWAIDIGYNLVLVVIDMIIPYLRLITFSVEIAGIAYRHVKDPTEAIQFVRLHTVTIRYTAGRSYRVFVSTAYDDLRMAIAIVQPIVQWVIDAIVWVARHLWDAASRLWTLGYTSACATMGWAHTHIGVPVKNVWDTKVMPGLTAAQVTIRVQMPALTAAIWSASVQMTVVLQAILTVMGQIMSKVADMSSVAGGRAQEQWKRVEPQYVEFKKQTGEAMDQVIEWMNDGIVDWTKNEKRD